MSLCLGCMEEKHTAAAECTHCGYVNGTPPREKYHMVPGEILHGKYIVGKVLGYGGFGVTYIGWDQALQRKVAIKEFLPGELATRMPGETMVRIYEKTYHQFESGLQRFVEEAQCLAKFNHVVSIVDVYDVFIENNTGYFVMEYLEGSDVKALIQKQGPFPYESARLIISDILKTLSIVHKEGILHRDISPDNIFITVDNRIKLLDFGAARYATDTYSEKLSIILKPGYAPEEQYRKNGVQGSWSDVYAVAATLYKMLTGITPQESIERLRNDTLQSPLELGVSIPVGANTALMRALQVQAKKRTHTAEDFLWELERTRVVAPADNDAVLKQEKKPAKPKKEGSKSAVWVVFASILAVLLVVWMGIVLSSGLSDAMAFPATDIDTGLSMVYYTDDPDFSMPQYFSDENSDGKPGIFALLSGQNPNHAEHPYGSIGEIKKIYLKVTPEGEGAVEGCELTVTANGNPVEPQDGYYVIEVNGKTDVAVQNVYSYIKFLPIKIFQTSSTYTFSCSSKEFAKFSGITYSIDGGDEISVPGFEADINNYVISEIIPANADEVHIVATPEDPKFTVTPGDSFSIDIQAIENEKTQISLMITVTDPTGEYETNEYVLTFNVAAKEQPKEVEVPSVKGMTENKAKQKLKIAGFNVVVETENVTKEKDAGKIVDSEPKAGKFVAPGSTITIYKGKYQASAPSPSVAPAATPTPVAEPTSTPAATPVITPAATPTAEPTLKVTPPTSTPTPTPKATPTPTSAPTVAPTAKPTATVMPTSTPAPMATIPYVAGYSLNKAKQILRDAGYQVSTMEEVVSSSYRVGIVLRTEPGAGQHVAPGSGVIIYVGWQPDTSPTEPTWIPSGSL